MRKQISNFQFPFSSLFICLFVYLTIGLLPARAQDATPAAADSVREKVREKIETLVRKPRALVGTLSEITDSTLRVQTRSGQLRMVATGEDTVFVRVARGKRSETKFEDLVLGDFVIAMGFANGNEVLEAKRVITHDKTPIPVRRAVYGVVQGNEEGTITISHPKTGEAWTAETSKDTKVTKKADEKIEAVEVEDIQAGDRIVAAGTPVEDEENTLTAGRIHVLPAP